MRGRTRVSGGNSRRLLRRLLVFVAVAMVSAAVIGFGSTARANAQPAPIDGIPTNCPSIDIGPLIEIPDGGWTWVDPAQPIQQVTGLVNQTIELDPTKDDPSTLSSFVRYSDLPAAHNSHDQNTHLTVDEADRGVLSLINDLGDDHAAIAHASDIAPPSQLEVEWETGLSPLGDFHGDGHAGANGGPMFPKWAWPNPGDRVWLMGNHIYDCGHPIEVAGVDRYKSEIHPAIAMAAMRDQVMTLPGTGTTPVPVVATDLYIHGDGGWATSVINTHEVFDQGTYYTTPIDRDYDFDIHLPAKPDPAAVLKWTVSDGPFNNINIAPVLTPDLSDPADPKLHVHVPLAGSGVNPLDTYGRQIVAGWAVPQGKVRHLRITLNQMVLHDDMEVGGADGELSFFWLNVPKSPTEWQRLSDFEIPTFQDLDFPCSDQTNTMEDYDDNQGCGNGILKFSGPTFDLFVMDGTPISIQAQGYDQDCDDGLYGIHTIASFGGFVTCFFPPFDGDNDPYKTLKVDLTAPNYHVGQLNVSNPDNQYEMHFTVTEVDSTPPTASPTQSPAANGAGWNNSDVTVMWNWTDEAGGSGIDPANCTTSSVSSGEGNPITLNASCTDQAGNTDTASYNVKVDKTAPTVTVTGVTSGGQYVFGAGPTPGCNSTDGLSGIATAATVAITTPPGGVGLYTATCSGAVDVAGNPQAANVSVNYTVVYGFGGFLSPLPKSTLTSSGSNIPVKFRLTNASGEPISASLSAALAAAGKVQVTLAGPPAVSQTVLCSWDAGNLFFQCNIKTPKDLLTGFGNPYTITAYEDVGTGFVVAPPVGTAVNPETVYFK
jgi:hypothetical protein